MRKRRKKNKLKASIKKEIYENPPPVLRLVRCENENISTEQATAGRSGETIGGILDNGGIGSDNRETKGKLDVVSATEDGGDDLRETIRRGFDPIEINYIFNHPSVFPLVSVPDVSSIDVSNLLGDVRNVCLVAEGGCILFVWKEPGIYEVHTAFIDKHRGKNALKSSLSAYRWMFTHTDCMTLLTKVPSNNPPAENFCKIVGATREFDRKSAWPTKDGLVDMSFWSLRYDDWVRKTTSLKKSGDIFHKKLSEEYLRLGKKEDIHAEEDCHDLYVGSCAEMIYGGQLDKAVILYNRWARFSGYGLISLVAHNPPMIDIGEALLQITGDTFKVILCRK